jgi:hypothetical protein
MVALALCAWATPARTAAPIPAPMAALKIITLVKRILVSSLQIASNDKPSI